MFELNNIIVSNCINDLIHPNSHVQSISKGMFYFDFMDIPMHKCIMKITNYHMSFNMFYPKLKLAKGCKYSLD